MSIQKNLVQYMCDFNEQDSMKSYSFTKTPKARIFYLTESLNILVKNTLKSENHYADTAVSYLKNRQIPDILIQKFLMSLLFS